VLHSADTQRLLQHGSYAELLRRKQADDSSDSDDSREHSRCASGYNSYSLLLLLFIILISFHTTHIIYARWAPDFTLHNSKHTTHTQNTLFMLGGPGVTAPSSLNTAEHRQHKQKHNTHCYARWAGGYNPYFTHTAVKTKHKQAHKIHYLC
jgi:hypothetical protein